jgi:hypothetical protein
MVLRCCGREIGKNDRWARGDREGRRIDEAKGGASECGEGILVFK